MLKYFILVLAVISVALVWMYAGIGGFSYRQVQVLEQIPLHRYKDSVFIDEISIAAFYFVPRNKRERVIEEWRDLLEKNLDKLVTFHDLQFQGRSRITYEIYPEPVVGREDNPLYDTDITQHGNPEALRRVSEELEGRVFNHEGDLYRPDFTSADGRFYRVLVILYEGVGASGSDNVAFLSRTFLTSPEYSSNGTTLLAHEFYHALGIPDGYELLTSVPTSEDIMGLGRIRLIDKTYISRSTLRAMGL